MLLSTLSLVVVGRTAASGGLGRRLVSKRVWNDWTVASGVVRQCRGQFSSKCSRLSIKTPKRSLILLGAVGVGVGGVAAIGFKYQTDQSLIKSLLDWLSSSLVKEAACDSSTQLDRTLQEEENIKSKRSDAFDWSEFYKLIKEEKWYFLAAIVVSHHS